MADYFAVDGPAVGARVRIISTTSPPLLATTHHDGAAVTLADGRNARFDNLAKLQVLTWQDGEMWYQIVAAHLGGGGAPYTVDELLEIAAGLT